MSKKSRFISIAIVVSLALSVTGGCKNRKKNSNDVQTVADDAIVLTNTVHGGKVEQTAEKVLKNGATEYKILVPAGSTATELKAGGIIAKYFTLASGADLPIVTDEGYSWNENSKVISVGETVAKKATGIAYTDSSRGGFIIKTRGKSIFLDGGADGLTYSAYELLKYWFNFEYYYENCRYYDINVKTVPFYEFDIRELPDIDSRHKYLSPVFANTSDGELVDGLRINMTKSYTGLGSDEHNALNYVPQSVYGKAHPEWYATINRFSTETGTAGPDDQLCYTALQKSQEAVDIVVEGMKKVVDAQSDIDIISFICADTRQWCACDECRESIEFYGCESASYIQFLNLVAPKINEWAKKERNRDVKVMAMMYLATEKAPVYDDGTPIDDSVICDKNLYVCYAPHAKQNYYVPFDDIENDDDYQRLNAWASLTEHMLFWTYNQASYRNYLVFYDNYNSIQRNMQILVKNNTVFLMDLGAWDSGVATGFNVLRTYLTSKLMYNCQLDVAMLINNFFDNYFGAASEPMREIFQLLRTRYAELYAEGVLTSAYGADKYASTDTLSKAMINKILALYDEAYAKADTIADISQRAQIINRIKLESISARYYKLRNDSESLGDGINGFKRNFKEDCTSLGFITYREHAEAPGYGAMKYLYSALGID